MPGAASACAAASAAPAPGLGPRGCSQSCPGPPWHWRHPCLSPCCCCPAPAPPPACRPHRPRRCHWRTRRPSRRCPGASVARSQATGEWAARCCCCCWPSGQEAGTGAAVIRARRVPPPCCRQCCKLRRRALPPMEPAAAPAAVPAGRQSVRAGRGGERIGGRQPHSLAGRRVLPACLGLGLGLGWWVVGLEAWTMAAGKSLRPRPRQGVPPAAWRCCVGLPAWA